MNTKISTLLVTALTVAACSAGGTAAPSPTRAPTQQPTATPTNPPSSSPTTPPQRPPTAPPQGNGPASINGRAFLSVKVTDGGQPRPLVGDTRIRLTFEDESLSAQAGCNIIGGTYEFEDGKLVFIGGGMTEMACDEPRMAQDQWLISFLGSQPTLTLDGDDLTLTAGETTISLLDAEVAEPDQALTGTTWRLTSLISGDAVSSVPADVVATMTFAEDGLVDVNPGCNNGAGNYSVDADVISFSDIITTKMACVGPAMQVENSVMQLLESEGLTFAIEANVLTITAGELGLQFSAS